MAAHKAGRGKELIDIVCDIMGYDEMPKDKGTMSVLARSLIAYQMYMEGFSEPYIGTIINRHHSTIHHLKERVKDMLRMPTFYPVEVGIWNEFKKRIENETDTTTI